MGSGAGTGSGTSVLEKLLMLRVPEKEALATCWTLNVRVSPGFQTNGVTESEPVMLIAALLLT